MTHQPPLSRRSSRRPSRAVSTTALLTGVALAGFLAWNVLDPTAPDLRHPILGRPPMGTQVVATGDGARDTAFDQATPTISNLDPDLLAALRRMATDARRDGVVFTVNSGWRSPAHQAELLREAVAEYGSAEEAARWVATPETSPHVAGEAVDLGPKPAAAWLAQHGSAYGLCQIYANEPWHFELRPDAVADGCPQMYADPTHDPRMAQ